MKRKDNTPNSPISEPLLFQDAFQKMSIVIPVCDDFLNHMIIIRIRDGLKSNLCAKWENIWQFEEQITNWYYFQIS